MSRAWKRWLLGSVVGVGAAGLCLTGSSAIGGGLRREYGALADLVLAHGTRIERDGAGFTADAPDGLRLRLPARGDGSVALETPDGMSIRVREVGAHGSPELVEGAVRYAREDGETYWTDEASGYEEWLDIEAGRAFAGESVAEWQVEGASLREHEGAILLADLDDVPRVVVRAPRAWARSGRPVATALHARGDRIYLEVDANGEAVLADPSWSLTGALNTARNDHGSAVLPDGRILVAGGRNGGGVLASAELYDPATNTWTTVAPMAGTRRLQAMAVLNDGSVMAAGGFRSGTVSLTSVEIYDPVANTWTAAPDLPGPGHWQTATTLVDGRVLIAGGDFPLNANTYLYDPVANTWSTAAPMNFARRHHRAVRLLDGRVLVIGGSGGTADGLPTAEIFDPVSGSWSETPLMAEGHRHPAVVMLPSGQVLAIGGFGATGAAIHGVAERYDPATDTWTTLAPMLHGRAYATAFLLATGEALLIGGEDVTTGDVTLRATELYDVASDTWAEGLPTSAVHGGRYTSALLASGRVLIAGGNTVVIGTVPVTATELYTATDPVGTACTSNRHCASGFCTDGVCCATACAGGTSDCQACAIAAGAAADGTCGPVSAGTSCNDGEPCTETDICSAGGACAGTPTPDACRCAPGTHSPDGTDLTECVPCEAMSYSGEGALACTAWTECPAEHFESVAPDATRDRECDACTVCGPGFEVAVACSATADTVCAEIGTDAAIADAGATDAGTRDAGARDGGATDAGARDGSPADAAADAGPSNVDTGGSCACRVGHARPGMAPWALLALGLALVVRRRRI